MVSYIWLTSGFVVVRVSPFVVVSSHNTVFSQSPHDVLSDEIFTCMLCYFDFGIPAGVCHSYHSQDERIIIRSKSHPH